MPAKFKSVFGLFFLFLVKIAHAQNLVVNPSFEDVNIDRLQCGFYQGPEDFNYAINGWINPTRATSDIYSLSLPSSCVCNPFSTDLVYRTGIQAPRTGKNMAAILTRWYSVLDYKEYIQNKLKIPLTVGERYLISFYVSLADSSIVGTNNIGVHLATTSKTYYDYSPMYFLFPQYETKSVITDRIGWTKVETYITATDPWQYLTIGNFKFNSDTEYLPYTSTNYYSEAYYFIDDVVVKKACLEVSPDTLICAGSTIDLVAKGAGFKGWALSNNPGVILTTDSVLKVSPVIKTSYKAYSQCDTNEVTVSIIEPFTFNLGQDREVCVSDTVKLELFVDNATYMWQNGNKTNKIKAYNTGYYWVTANINNCYSYTDTIFIKVDQNPIVNLGKDTGICEGKTLLLNAYNKGATYLWSDGSTDSVFIVKKRNYSGYNVQVTLGKCVRNDGINVNMYYLPVFDLGKDTTICRGKNLYLSAQPQSYGPVTYLWGNQSTKSSYVVSDAGIYYATATSLYNNCSYSDTIKVTYKNVGEFDLGNDTTLCAGQALLLDATIPPVATYKWNNGASTPDFTVNKKGFYKVAVTKDGCTKSDSINVDYYDKLSVNLGPDRGIYHGQSIILNASDNASTSYLWQDGTSNPTFSVNQGGKYFVTVSNGNNCYASDSVTIVEIELEMPNVFTPNDDGVNERFVPISQKGIVSSEMTIYNRWGKLVFKSNDLVSGWDGANAADGVYYWYLSYMDYNGNESSMKGDLTLFR